MSANIDPTRQQEFDAAIDQAAAVTSLFLPQYSALIVMGQAAAKAAPGVYADLVALIEKREPTVEDKADLARKLRALANPETA